jgi:hypothetical protein
LLCTFFQAAGKIDADDNKVKLATIDSSDNGDASVESQQADVSSEVGDDDIEKRGIGKWKNIMWSQSQGKRNLGRWKNRNWRDMQSYGLQGRSGGNYGHFLSKRFSGDSDAMKISENTYKDIPEYGILNGDFIIPDSYAYDDVYGDVTDADPEYNNVDKRHRSRWNLIHRKLSQLNADKREDSSDDVKRMASRWRIIQNKLNQLHSKNNKRFAGRWKNQNWLLQQANKQ